MEGDKAGEILLHVRIITLEVLFSSEGTVFVPYPYLCTSPRWTQTQYLTTPSTCTCFHSYDFMQEADLHIRQQVFSLLWCLHAQCFALRNESTRLLKAEGYWSDIHTPLLFLHSGVVVGIIFAKHFSMRLLLVQCSVQCSQFAFVCIYIYISVTLPCLSEPLLSYCLPTQQAFFTALHQSQRPAYYW